TSWAPPDSEKVGPRRTSRNRTPWLNWVARSSLWVLAPMASSTGSDTTAVIVSCVPGMLVRFSGTAPGSWPIQSAVGPWKRAGPVREILRRGPENSSPRPVITDGRPARVADPPDPARPAGRVRAGGPGRLGRVRRPLRPQGVPVVRQVGPPAGRRRGRDPDRA